ncbi:MAG TPA: hypothetical protein VHO03_17105 [Ignavibacteriales bacterium]|nr:hypothetical protein [Ignavibacteriales bacterium]
MTSVFISPCDKRIYLLVVNPKTKKIAKLYTGYSANQPEALNKVTFLKDWLMEWLEENERYISA